MIDNDPGDECTCIQCTLANMVTNITQRLTAGDYSFSKEDIANPIEWARVGR